jgi:methyl-accepting chemotaxis protein
MDLNEAVRAHSDWKIKLRGAITQHKPVDVAAISRDDGCVLGKWLHGESRPAYGPLETHKKCLRMHAAFHRAAGLVAERINAGDYAKAEEMLTGQSDYSKASSEVVASIMELKREANL